MAIRCVIFYRDERGKEISQRGLNPQQANERLNELWGEWGRRGPAQHPEARALVEGWGGDDRPPKAP